MTSTEPSEVPACVRLYVWHVPPSRRTAALVRVALDRFRVRRHPGVRFAKVLGTSSGTSFTPRDADLSTWALLTTWAERAAADAFDRQAAPVGWREIADEEMLVEMTPVSSHGRWSRREPFGAPVPRRTSGPVAAVTRGRIRLSEMNDFRRQTPPVGAAVREAAGLRLAIGIGELPVGLQGTFSLWDSHRSLVEFAYRDPAHQQVIERTRRTGWYAEDLFARFSVETVRGTVRGRDPLSDGGPRS